MSVFLLCLRNDQQRSQGEIRGVLEGLGEELLHPWEACLEWQYYELMVWRIKLSSALIAKQLDGCAGPAELGIWRVICQRFCAVLPTHYFRWRLLLLRREHDLEIWRVFCQRVRFVS